VWLNNNGTFCTATGQEIGHNFGMMHASTMDCGSAIMANDTRTCSSSEYGNRLTVMGGGCRHLISVEKWYSGYFGGCNGARIRSSGTFTLFPIETACNGIQGLQIPFSPSAPARITSTDQSNGDVTVNYYYLELRGGAGIDTGVNRGVYVHLAPDIPAPNRNGPRTFMLDMNPSTSAFDPMSAGQTFTDPAGGVSFTVESFDQSRATIRVEIQGGGEANTCMDGSTLSGSGPADCGGSGGTGGSGGAGGSTGGTGGAGGSTGGAGGTGGSTGGAGGSTGGSGGSTGGTGGAGGSTGGAGGTGTGGAGAGGAGGSDGGGGSGSGGEPGTGGASGAGVGGSSGSDGSGGSGVAGAGAAGGAAGNGGVSGSDGVGGSAAGGSGAVGGTTTDQPGLETPIGLSDDDAGCACRTVPERRSGGSGLLLGLGLLGLLATRRRVR